MSDRQGGSISDEDRHYEDGSDVALLDIVDIPVTRHSPTPIQRENWEIDPRWYWTRIDQFPGARLAELLDQPEVLWTNGYSTIPGENDRIPGDLLGSTVPASLFLLRVSVLRVRVLRPGMAYGDAKRKVRGAFTWNGIPYDFTITDPVAEAKFKEGKDGEFDLGEQLITVSLGEPHNDGYAYKFIAALLG